MLGLIAWSGIATLLLLIPTAALGPAGILVGGAAATLAFLVHLVYLPRAAHAAFTTGRLPRAARHYRLLGALALTTTRERAALLSRAGCALAAGAISEADALHAKLDPATLTPAERAVWLNNRACALLAAARPAADALAIVEEAIALRPDVPAIHHTRGMALLAQGRADDAIAVLDGMRAAGELPDRLEAERCRELAKAWDAKGQAAYADDYRERARRLG